MKTEVWVIALNQLVLEDLRKHNTKWVKEARYELNECLICEMAEYLDIRIKKMARLN